MRSASASHVTALDVAGQGVWLAWAEPWLPEADAAAEADATPGFEPVIQSRVIAAILIRIADRRRSELPVSGMLMASSPGSWGALDGIGTGVPATLGH